MLFGSLHSTLLKLQGAADWPETEGLVYSCCWTDGSLSESPSFWTVTYSYRVDGELHASESEWVGQSGEPVYHRGDVIVIRYNPRRPGRSYVPERQSLHIGTFFTAVVVITVLILLLCLSTAVSSHHTSSR